MKQKRTEPEVLIINPTIRKEELERSKSTYREYQLTEEERQAIIDKYGPPTRPPNRVTTLTSTQGRVRPSMSRSK